MRSGKEYSMLFQLNAQLASNFNSVFKSGQKEIVALQKEIDALSKTQSDISAFEKQQNAVAATQKKMEVLQQQYDNVQKEIKETETFSASLENQLLSKQQQIDKTSLSLEQQTQKLNNTENALSEAGVDTTNLANASSKLSEELQKVKQAQEEAADSANNYGKSSAETFAAIQQALVSTGIIAAFKAIAEYSAECAKLSMEFESAMTGVAKTTDLTDEELKAMGTALQVLSTEIPATTTELAGVAEAAGQLGIAEEYILEFTEVMTNLGVATNLTSETAATQLAKFANITQMAATEYEQLGSTIVALGNNSATTEADIVNMAMRLAAAGKQSGMTEAEILSMSAALSSLGLESQAGGSAFSKVIMQMQVAVETGSDSLYDFAEVAGMSAQEFAHAFGNDAAGALSAFVTGLSDTQRLGASATVLLDEMGISELRMSDALKRAAESGDLFNETLALGNQAWAENTALTAEASQRYATTESKLMMMQNSYNNLRVSLGDTFLPVLQKLYDLATNVMNAFTEFVQKNPALMKSITTFIGVLGGLVIAFTAVSAIIKVVIPLMKAFAGSIPGLGVFFTVATGIAAFTAALAACSEESQTEEAQLRRLSAASREQYYELQDLTAEYDNVVAKYGETSVKAQLLKKEVDACNIAFEENKETAAEVATRHKEVQAAYAGMREESENARKEIDREEQSIYNLTSRLSVLAETENKSNAAKQEMLSIIEILNDTMPELALTYDAYTDSLNLTADAIEKLAEQELSRRKNETSHDDLLGRIAKREKLEESLASASLERADAEKFLAEAEKAKLEAMKKAKDHGQDWNRTSASLEHGMAVEKATNALNDWIASEKEASDAVKDNERQINSLSESMAEYTEVQAESNKSTFEMQELISSTTAEMGRLREAYEQAYESALSSVQGQYNLWDEAAEVQATSAKKMNASMQEQITYWQNYNSNIDSLTGRASEIEGLSDVIGSFADGSPDAVNAIAGMASATDEELAVMVTKFQALQKEHDTTATSIAELQTSFSASMEALEQTLESTIQKMDMNEIAAVSGKNTIQGFIDGAEGMVPRVHSAYSRIAQTAIAAINSQLGSSSVSPNAKVDGSHAGGLEYVPYDGYIAELHKGERVLTAEEVQLMTTPDSVNSDIQTAQVQVTAFAPQFIEALSAVQSNTPISANVRESNSSPISVNFAPVYNLEGVSDTSQMKTILAEHDENMKEYISEVLEEIATDSVRRRYE